MLRRHPRPCPRKTPRCLLSERHVRSVAFVLQFVLQFVPVYYCVLFGVSVVVLSHASGNRGPPSHSASLLCSLPLGVHEVS